MKAIRSIRPGAWKAHRQDESSRHRQIAPERMDPQGGAGGVFSSGRGIYPRIVKQLLRTLYSQGSGTTGARHASVEGIEPTGPRAELAIHVAAALHAYVVSELDVG